MLKKSAPPTAWTTKRIGWAAGGTAALGALLIGIGLLFSGSGRATVTGRVTYQGRPVIWGSVILVGENGRHAVGAISPDGTYQVKNAPPGAVSVGVVSRDPLVQTWAANFRSSRARPTAKTFAVAPPVDRRLWFPLPQQYEEPTNSGITLNLSKGRNENDIALR